MSSLEKQRFGPSTARFPKFCHSLEKKDTLVEGIHLYSIQDFFFSKVSYADESKLAINSNLGNLTTSPTGLHLLSNIPHIYAYKKKDHTLIQLPSFSHIVTTSDLFIFFQYFR